jgi:hypothetical protein
VIQQPNQITSTSKKLQSNELLMSQPAGLPLIAQLPVISQLQAGQPTMAMLVIGYGETVDDVKRHKIKEIDERLKKFEPKLSKQKSMSKNLREAYDEFPEVLLLAEKLSSGGQLNKQERLWLKELAEAAGWDINDIDEELTNLKADPPERANRYKELFEGYYKEAVSLYEKGDYLQAAEKLWGAITVLVKLHAALKGVFIVTWSHARLYEYVRNHVEEANRQHLYDLLKAGEPLHRYFYEKDLDAETFRDLWNDAAMRLKTAKDIVYSLLTR